MKDEHVKDAAQGVAEDVPQDVAQDLASTRPSKPHPQAPPPDPRLKPGPVFVASGGVITVTRVR